MVTKRVRLIEYVLTEEEVKAFLKPVLGDDIPDNLSSINLYHDGEKWIGPVDQSEATDEMLDDPKNWKEEYVLTVGGER